MQELKNKIYGSGTTTLIILNEEMNDILKIVQALKDSNILLKGFTKKNKNETKEEKGRFLGMLLGTLGASLLGNTLAGKGLVKSWLRKGKRKKNCKSWLRKYIFLMPLQPLKNFEIQKYYQNKTRFNVFFSRDDLPKKNKGWDICNKP